MQHLSLKEEGGNILQTTLWTIGHSNHSLKNFLELLKEHEIQILVDVRRFPTSKIEHFKREFMGKWLPSQGITYLWLGAELGGYRKGGYLNYMKTMNFKRGIKKLIAIASEKRTCIMCMEISPKHCHRRFIASYLENKGIKVVHITKKGQQILA